MKKLCFIIITVFFNTYYLSSQSKPLHEDVQYPYSRVPRVGPNGRHYLAAMYGSQISITTDKTSLAPTFKVGTIEYHFGFIYKLRITSWISTGLTTNYATYGYIYLNDSLKVFPDIFSHRKQSIRTGLAEGSFYLRFNYDPKRGDILGKYIDFFVWGGFPIMRRHYYQDQVNKEIYSVKVKNYQGLTTDLQYGFGIRQGSRSFCIYLKYRLSNMLAKSFPEIYEPPRWTIGIVHQFKLLKNKKK